jgi:hypothetical protein
MDCCATGSQVSQAVTLGGVFVASLAGSLHCIGMCGPLLATVEAIRPGQFSPWRQLPMHAGRLITYAILGAVFGTLGLLLERVGSFAGVQGVASLLGGAAMIVFALVLMDLLPWKPLMRVSEAKIQGLVARLSRRTVSGGLTMGLAWGLLPCGLVWGFLLGAAAAAGPVRGALVMLIFGAGTIPALLVAGGLGGLVGPRLRRLMPRLAAASVMILGALMVLRGAAGAGLIPHLQLASGVPLF